MRNYRAIGGLAVLLLLGTVFVPVLIDRAKPTAAPEATAQPTTMASEVRLPPAARPSTGKSSTAGPKTTPVADPIAGRLGPRGEGSIGKIGVPGNARPLPNRDVPPGVLAYSTNCPDTTKLCWSWRLLDWKGRHWALPKGTAFSLSPNGRRVGYFQPDGRFVLRDLASGAVDQPVQIPGRALDGLDPHVTWSPNGRWLAIDYQAFPSSDKQRRAVLVDTTTMRNRILGIACCVAGLQPTGDWLLIYDLYGPRPDRFQLRDAYGGRTVRTIDPAQLSEQRWAKGRTGYPLSPDGRRFAIFLSDREAGTYSLGLVDTTGKVSGRYPLPAEDVSWGELIGWPDVRTVAAVTENNGQVLTYDIQTRKLRDAYTFPDPPDRLTVAVSLVRAQ
jgi:hypothetical protein